MGNKVSVKQEPKFRRVTRNIYPPNQINYQGYYGKNLGDDRLVLTLDGKTNNTHELDLGSNCISPIGMLAFASIDCSKLVLLSLYRNQIADKGCQYLTRAKLINLRSISLGNNQIQSEGVLHLSKSQWKKLEKMHLIENLIGMDSIRWLSKGNWPCLKDVSLGWNRLTYRQLKNLSLMPPKQRIKFSILNNCTNRDHLSQIMYQLRKRNWQAQISNY